MHVRTFELKGLTFEIRGFHIFLGDQEISLKDLVLFAQGKIDLRPPEPEPTIVDVVLDVSGAEGLDDNGDDFDILREALIATDLVGTLADPNADFTVFAPTDAAFIQLARDLGADVPDGDESAALLGILTALEDLAGSAEGAVDLLAQVLLYHVAPGAQTLAELQHAGVVTTVQGGEIEIDGTRLGDLEPDITDPNVATPDLQTANGTIHIIDRVLLPVDIPGNETLDNIVDIAAGSDDFNILVQALDAANLVDAVRNSPDITVFAPTDAAFTQLALDLGFDGDTADEGAVFGFIAGALAGLAPDGDPIPLLTDILLYHVSPGAKTAEEIDDLDQVETLLDGVTFGSEGTELIDNEPDIDNPNIVIPDIPAANGTIQAIDHVLIPLDFPGNTPGEVIEGTNFYDKLIGTDGNDEIFGLKGADLLKGGDGNDLLDGGGGRDLLKGGDGDDKLFGGLGRDKLNGGDGDDHLSGGRGRDWLKGGDGDDKLFGGLGRDKLNGGDGDDHLSGGRGRDVFDFRHISGEDVVEDLTRWDIVVLSKDDFQNFHALEAATTFEEGNTVVEGEEGSITFAGVDEHELNAHQFVFV